MQPACWLLELATTITQVPEVKSPPQNGIAKGVSMSVEEFGANDSLIAPMAEPVNAGNTMKETVLEETPDAE
jgi:hypothetical protein